VLPVPGSYVGLSSLFEATKPATVDAELSVVDRALFGTTPAAWLERFNTVSVNEWFSLFYESFYLVLALGVLVPLVVDRGQRLQETMLGSALVAMVGHVTYTLLPGAGPYASIAFTEPVHGGFWWNIVRETVAAEGMLDVFPSVHTAMPLLFTLVAFRHRKSRVFRYLWPVLALVTSQIVVATMLLRWHWAIDIVAGLCLGSAAFGATVAISRREHAQRLAGNVQPVWEPLFGWQR
jgi:hypothetical protein